MNRRSFFRKLAGAALGAAAAVYAPNVKAESDEVARKVRMQALVRESQDTIRRMHQEFIETLFYGSPSAARSSEFTGFAKRYSGS